jgi:hypothetical protein
MLWPSIGHSIVSLFSIGHSIVCLFFVWS